MIIIPASLFIVLLEEERVIILVYTCLFIVLPREWIFLTYQIVCSLRRREWKFLTFLLVCSLCWLRKKMVIIPASLFIVLLEKRDGYHTRTYLFVHCDAPRVDILDIPDCLFIVLQRVEILDIPARLFIELVEEEDGYHTC